MRRYDRPHEVQPDIAWANQDMYNLGRFVTLVTCLKASRLRWVQSKLPDSNIYIC